MSKKRIKNLSQAKKDVQSDIVKCFIKGIFNGTGNGKCTQNRTYSKTQYLTTGQAKTIVKRIKTKSVRKKLSPDGQVIRTTKLPKNYKSYNYILESFPNSFYEKKFTYQNTTYDTKPVYLKDYASPKDAKKHVRVVYGKKETAEKFLNANIDRWCKKLEENLALRFNFNYKTSGTKWITDLRNTYYLYNDPQSDKQQTDLIKYYVKQAKANKVILKSAKITVEPSTLYYDGSYLLRCYVKFKVVSAKNIPTALSWKQNINLIFSDGTSLTGLKKGQWYEGYFDLAMSTSTYGGTGEEYGVSHDYFVK